MTARFRQSSSVFPSSRALPGLILIRDITTSAISVSDDCLRRERTVVRRCGPPAHLPESGYKFGLHHWSYARHQETFREQFQECSDNPPVRSARPAAISANWDRV